MRRGIPHAFSPVRCLFLSVATVVFDFMLDSMLIPYVKVLVAAVIGFVIGIERKTFHKHVGPRTYSLICLGSCVFTLASVMFETDAGSGYRIAAQIVAGIGFLGAGVIWKYHDQIIGITTAASIWVVASLGVIVGFGFYGLALFTTILVIVILHIKSSVFWDKLSDMTDDEETKGTPT
jgi:putative Mg2+ transporter-C (MgtC) family protein